MARTNLLRKLVAPLLLAGSLATAGTLALTGAPEPRTIQASDTSWGTPGDTSWGSPTDTSWGTPGVPSELAPSGESMTDMAAATGADTSWG
ncbi:hypothetical protein [Streptomyces sp. MZ04]|uniref:hypothetical protein n=1 Tax=Streptomyces sp. MZ04 TaxID=2559236 RepID=UPI00107E8589|nr:hypothetical protein [Streptomyces sp. MZ04]TGB14395.1 hypothetical protein E2651_06105 [Streptomyces sp. MZ04]